MNTFSKETWNANKPLNFQWWGQFYVSFLFLMTHCLKHRCLLKKQTTTTTTNKPQRTECVKFGGGCFSSRAQVYQSDTTDHDSKGAWASNATYHMGMLSGFRENKRRHCRKSDGVDVRSTVFFLFAKHGYQWVRITWKAFLNCFFSSTLEWQELWEILWRKLSSLENHSDFLLQLNKIPVTLT